MKPEALHVKQAIIVRCQASKNVDEPLVPFFRRNSQTSEDVRMVGSRVLSHSAKSEWLGYRQPHDYRDC
jgi:hypothetical protein